MIGKIQSDPNNYRFQLYYYNRARDAMKDTVGQAVEKGYRTIYIPGYIGWSPREGSGIFDPLNSIPALERHYYLMDGRLRVNVADLEKNLPGHSILLLVNYFGFRDERFAEIVKMAHDRDSIVIEDNAHGFFTYFCGEPTGSDITFFSLHKMFPFSTGGGLLIENPLLGIKPSENIQKPAEQDPFSYNIHAIARRRIGNYSRLMRLVRGKEQYFVPLIQEEELKNNVPQTFPIIIQKGDRNRIYEIMNGSGYGVVSLYHTMIEELRNERHRDACRLSEHIMNLPVHQDCDAGEYPAMIDALIKACESTEQP